MRRSRHRQFAAIAALLSVAFAGVVVGTAAAERDHPAAHANSLWLAKQLKPDGTLDNPMGAKLPDHGLMIDVLLATYASGDGHLAAPIVKYLDDDGYATDYFTWRGLMENPEDPELGPRFEKVITGGAVAKTLVAAQVSGRNPRDFDGYDLVAETKAAIMRSGPDKGRVSDYSKDPALAEFISNEANTFGQALGVIGLAGVDEVDHLALGRLLTQQCSEGYFRIFYKYIPTTETGDHVNSAKHKVSTCDEGKPSGLSPTDGDSTGMGLSALLAARKAGAAGLDEPIARAVGWLKANQKPDGGWGGGVGTEDANTNSTGLIVQALTDVGGAETEVAKGVAFIKSAQVKPADANTAIGAEIGAIHYTPEQYEKAKAEGRGALDKWVRAGAQASLALSGVGFHDLTKRKIPEPPTTTTTTTTGGPTTTSSTTTSSTTSSSAATTTTSVSRPAVDGTTTQQPPTPAATPPPAATQQAKPKTAKPIPKPKPRRAALSSRGTASSTTPTVVTPPPVASPQQPGPATSPAGRLGEYLSQRLVNGDHVEVTENNETFVDYDATADLVLALRVLGEQPEVAERVSKFLLRQDSVRAYAHGSAYEKDSAVYAEPLAKLRVVAGFVRRGDDSASDLDATVDQLRTDLASTRTEDGKFADRGEFADSDNSVRRHAWAVLATAADDEQSSAGLTLLIKRQCTDGTFPASLKTEQCDTGDLVATAAAVEALNGRKRGDAPSEGAPRDWSSDRANALVKAVDALAGTSEDIAVTSAVTGARDAVGLDVRDTAEALRAKLLSDGGLPRLGAEQSDLVASVASAQGVAGKSWMNATDSPVTPAARLPIGEVKPATNVAATHRKLPDWTIGGLIGLGILLLAAAGYGTYRYINRKTPIEGTRS
ncbi:hypothetical protein ALI144C_17485 [Actinosynnema sp. ALI-1.44]|uniref:hypothetical protein n=1 Tax=Actinosynnema sp. ALI-1.44 TaxID=1933779 RepID=UPI00097C4A6B|nr:hypothetical protein [Actinosynnema sp. ALI-1.44]ONI82859.1 hypothetical protein ALI144C_17485 [Actinosynnema sp. ALI-1.44]